VLLSELTRNATNVLPDGELERKLALGRPLRVKLGIDVTAPDVTLGNGIPLQRMRAFQDAGHLGVLIVGDYTTRIGDPSGRSAERPIIAPEVIDANAQRYFEHASTIIDPGRTELRFNSEWLAKLDFAEILRLTRTTTIARLLERDDFSKRYAAKEPISVSELLYPLMQAYDSVAVRADVELGGTDQLFNLLLGRSVQEAYGQEPQVALTMPILPGTDGVRRMSKSLGNYIGVAEDPDEQFGKAMSVPDEAMGEWMRLLFPAEPQPDGHPGEEKRRLARLIVDRFNGPGSGTAAEERFNRVFRERRAPEDMEIVAVPPGPVHLPALLVDGLGVASRSEARRLIEQGGVTLDGEPVQALDLAAADLDGRVLRAGRRRFARVMLHEGQSRSDGG
jgi:tyrosyl-tRNA synthetase